MSWVITAAPLCLLHTTGLRTIDFSFVAYIVKGTWCVFFESAFEVVIRKLLFFRRGHKYSLQRLHLTEFTDFQQVSAQKCKFPR